MGNGPKLIAAMAVLLATAAPAMAQDRTPAERQTLVALTYIMGESNALHQVCSAIDDRDLPADQAKADKLIWYTRMRQLVAAEQPDAPFNRRLADSFNDGFVAGQQAFPSCTAKSRREAKIIAAKGRELSVTLSSDVADDEPTR
jgi:uncharacterized protein (TIGR02301 family)